LLTTREKTLSFGFVPSINLPKKHTFLTIKPISSGAGAALNLLQGRDLWMGSNQDST